MMSSPLAVFIVIASDRRDLVVGMRGGYYTNMALHVFCGEE